MTVPFADVWERVGALKGTTVSLADGGTNEILGVDHRGVTRRTSTGNISRIPTASFESVVDRLNEQGELSRMDILAGIRRRESSGVVAILAATGLYEITRDPTVGLRICR